ncbi:uncharacterized protein LOC122808082 [Protopterus annectens]|uniref:uncharacterized protein LOC122808082 n=1 Tax=Protopterus annectens TaxID=7888 RepID=UPI001CFA6893|nr:uncharacterized protein LOC122808082 [Protopterus annectens]
MSLLKWWCVTLFPFLAGGLSGVSIKEDVMYGIENEPLFLIAEYFQDPSTPIEIIIWELKKEMHTTRILQHIMNKNLTILSDPYKSRLHFYRDSGSLQLQRFANSTDVGVYEIILIDSNGAEIKASMQVKQYERIEELSINVQKSTIASSLVLLFVCSVKSGTAPQFSWQKDGKNITCKTTDTISDYGINYTMDVATCNLSTDGTKLTFVSGSHTVCGNFSCTAKNQLNVRMTYHTVSDEECSKKDHLQSSLRHYVVIYVFPLFLIAVIIFCIYIKRRPK